jgi:uncharacterized protein with HEPN domain
MPSRDTGRILRTIAHNIELAHRFVEDMAPEAFAKDERTLYAVTRCLEIISEASRRLPNGVKERHREVPWDLIAASGNVYRHDYEDVLPSLLWNTVQDHLGLLERVVREEIQDIERRGE